MRKKGGKGAQAPKRRLHLFFRSLFNLLEEIYPVRRHHLQSPKVHSYQSFTVPEEEEEEEVYKLGLCATLLAPSSDYVMICYVATTGHDCRLISEE